MKMKDALDGYLLDCQMRNRSPKTIHLYSSLLNMLVRWFGDQGIENVEQVTVAHLRAFIMAMQQRVAGENNPRRPPAKDGHTLTPATIASYVKAIKVWFKWLAEEEVIDKNPSLRLVKPQEPKKVRPTLGAQSLQALFKTCDLQTWIGFRNYTIMLMLLDTGIRVSELCSLTLENVHDGYLKIDGKGRKEREVGISPSVSKFLWKYIHLYRSTTDDAVQAVFTGLGGRKLTDSGVEKVLKRAARDSEFDGGNLTAHKFRHTFARVWLEQGGDVYSLSRLMGHSSVKITEIYLEEFTSRQARTQHHRFSPTAKMRVVTLFRSGGSVSGQELGPRPGMVGKLEDHRWRAQQIAAMARDAGQA